MELMVIPRQVELSSAPWHSNDGELLWGGGMCVCLFVCVSSSLLASRAWKQALCMCTSVCMCACFTDLMAVGVYV